MDIKDLEKAAIPFAIFLSALLLLWKLSPRAECAEHSMFYLKGTSLDCDSVLMR